MSSGRTARGREGGRPIGRFADGPESRATYSQALIERIHNEGMEPPSHATEVPTGTTVVPQTSRAPPDQMRPTTANMSRSGVRCHRTSTVLISSRIPAPLRSEPRQQRRAASPSIRGEAELSTICRPFGSERDGWFAESEYRRHQRGPRSYARRSRARRVTYSSVSSAAESRPAETS